MLGSYRASETLRTHQRMNVYIWVHNEVKTARKPSWQPHGQASRENEKMSFVVFWIWHWLRDPANGDRRSHEAATTTLSVASTAAAALSLGLMPKSHKIACHHA